MEEPNPPEKRDIHTEGGSYNESIDGNYVQGNFIQNFINYFAGQSVTPVGNSQREHNQRILLAEVKSEVTGRLKQSLHNAVFTYLNNGLQPQYLSRIWDAEIKIGKNPSETIPSATTILEVFDREEIAGKLLILGEPGSGRTTTQLELAQSLIVRAEVQPDYPIPVLLHFSSWKDKDQLMSDWLINEVQSKYGVSRQLIKEWFKKQELIFLLDGLDEVKPILQESCVTAINHFINEEKYGFRYLVISCNSKNNQNYYTHINLDATVSLQPLTTNQIHDYLILCNQLNLWLITNNNSEIIGLMKNPLLLNIIIMGFPEIFFKQKWHLLKSTNERSQHLLNAYVRQMLIPSINSRIYIDNNPPKIEKSQQWLVWLSTQLTRESISKFSIEELQPYWLRTSFQRGIYKLIVALIKCVLFIVLYGIVPSLFLGNFLWFSSTVLTGVIVGLLFALKTKVKSIEPLKFYYQNLNNILINSLKHSSFWGLILVLHLILYNKILLFLLAINLSILQKSQSSFDYIDTEATIIAIQQTLSGTLSNSFLIAILTGVFCGIIVFTMKTKLHSSRIEIKIIPNQGIWLSLTNANLFGLCSGVFSALLTILLLGRDGIFGLAFGLFFGLAFWLFYGGNTCIEHFSLRLVLYCKGYIPWNYSQFLNYCADRSFLQHVDGRYRFTHKILQDHFAKMGFKRN